MSVFSLNAIGVEEVDWDVEGPTKGTATLIGNLRRAGRYVLDAGQGAELPVDYKNPEKIKSDPSAQLIARIAEKSMVELTALYNDEVGGPAAVRNSALRYLEAFYRISPDHVFSCEAHGRAVMKLLFEQAGAKHADADLHGYKPIIVMQDVCWATIRNLARDLRMRVVGFDHRNPDITQAVQQALENENPAHVAAVVLNYPHNPTSMATNSTEVNKLLDFMDDLNATEGDRAMCLFDMPYVYACPTAHDDKGECVLTGVENIAARRRRTSIAGAMTSSKFFISANKGHSLIWTLGDNFPAKDFKRRLGDSALGIARVDAYTENVGIVLSGAFDEALWARMRQLRGKYSADLVGVYNAAGEGHMIKGQPGMLATSVYDPSNILDKKLIGRRTGLVHQIKTGEELVTFMAVEHGFGPVYGGETPQGLSMIRFALREEPKDFVPAAEGGFKQGIEEVLDAGKIGEARVYLSASPPSAPDKPAQQQNQPELPTFTTIIPHPAHK